MAHTQESRASSPNTGIVVCGIVGIFIVSLHFWFQPWLLEQPQFNQPLHPLAAGFADNVLNLIEKLGDALLIASFLALVVDYPAKLNLAFEAAKGASRLIICEHLPDDLKAAILKLTESEFVRRNWKIVYKLEPTSSPGIVEFTSVISGEVENRGKLSKEFRFKGSVDRSPVPAGCGQSKLLGVKIKWGKRDKDKFECSGASLAAHTTVGEDGSTIFERPRVVNAGGKIETSIESLEFLPDSYIMPLFVGTCVNEAELTVLYDASKFDVVVSVGTSQNLQGESDFSGESKAWKIETPLLPGHCILTAWYPVKPSGHLAPPDALATPAKP